MIGLKQCLKFFVSGFLFGCFCLFLALLVPNSLQQICYSIYFAVFFGVSLCLLGIVLAYRIFKLPMDALQKRMMFFFSVLVLVSGVFCFLLKRGWVDPPNGIQVLMFGAIGISLSFSLTYSLTEILNVLSDKYCSPGKPFLAHRFQVFFMFTFMMSLGLIFGLLFGIMGVHNDVTHSKIQTDLLITCPLGFVIGGILGVLIQYYRNQQIQTMETQNIYTREFV
eukprot:TRINITY_DN15876_c0_g1_i1.p1 TRINITY_DN15876_c0_g1~~TRINITY_DN15876_c0_g1_i1.p1  ORF type:complete len:223 (-),score=12.59 TRINITY_DN15876_c0_g1_i1:36-704(-)